MRRPLAAITGGTGFLGRHVTEALVARGWRVRLLVRRPPLPAALAALSPEMTAGDLANERALDELVRGADAVIHCAGLVRAASEREFVRTNTEGSRQIGQAVHRSAPDCRFIVVSSIAARTPQLSAYAASKRAGEDAAASERGNASLAILRPTAVYGPWDRETLRAFRAVRRAMIVVPATEGRISLLHAVDFAEAVAAMVDNRAIEGTFEVTDSRWEGYSWQELVAALAAALDAHPRILRLPAAMLRAAAPLLHAAGLGRSAPLLDPGKLREILHDDWTSRPAAQLPSAVWHPRVGLKAGLTQTARWYFDHGWMTPAHLK